MDEENTTNASNIVFISIYSSSLRLCFIVTNFSLCAQNDVNWITISYSTWLNVSQSSQSNNTTQNDAIELRIRRKLTKKWLAYLTPEFATKPGQHTTLTSTSSNVSFQRWKTWFLMLTFLLDSNTKFKAVSSFFNTIYN